MENVAQIVKHDYNSQYVTSILEANRLILFEWLRVDE